LRLSYTRDLRGDTSLEIFGNIANVLDEDPPVTPYFSVFLGYATQTNSGLFDLLGRNYTAGVRLRF
jgi:outer membrane receptor protein involved in Fe transport